MTFSRKNGGKSGDGRFQLGNPGKPCGARHRITRAIEGLLEGEHEALTRKAIEKALEGDYRAEHLFALKQSLEAFDHYQKQIAECDQEIAKHVRSLETKAESGRGLKAALVSEIIAA